MTAPASQSEAEIRSVVQEAQKSSATNPAGWEVRRAGRGLEAGLALDVPPTVAWQGRPAGSIV